MDLDDLDSIFDDEEPQFRGGAGPTLGGPSSEPGGRQIFATWPDSRPAHHITVESRYTEYTEINQLIQREAEIAGFGAVRQRSNYRASLTARAGKKVPYRVDFQCHCSGIPGLNEIIMQILC
jgi:hypothetical protein